MIGDRIAGVFFVAVAGLALGDRLGYYNLSPTVFVALVLMGIGVIILARGLDRDRRRSPR